MMSEIELLKTRIATSSTSQLRTSREGVAASAEKAFRRGQKGDQGGGVLKLTHKKYNLVCKAGHHGWQSHGYTGRGSWLKYRLTESLGQKRQHQQDSLFLMTSQDWNPSPSSPEMQVPLCSPTCNFPSLFPPTFGFLMSIIFSKKLLN